jgi:hypothetical protein
VPDVRQPTAKLTVVVPPAVISMANGPPMAAVMIRDLVEAGGLACEIFDANVRFLRRLRTAEISRFVLTRIDERLLQHLNRKVLEEADLTELGRDLTFRYYEQLRWEVGSASRLGIEWAGVSEHLIDEPAGRGDREIPRILDDIFEDLAHDILKGRPSAIGFTAMFHLQFRALVRIANELRAVGFAGPMIVGGAATKLTTSERLEALLQDAQLDLAYPHDLHGPPEALIAYLTGKARAADVPGGQCRGRDTKRLQPARNRVAARSALLAGPLHYQLDEGAEYFPERIFPVLVSEGCYWGKCDFCDYPYLASRDPFTIRATFRQPEHVVADIRTVHERHGIRHIDLISDAVPPGYFARLEQAGAGEFGDRLSLECSIRAESQVQDVHFAAMKRVGIATVTIGVEALSDEVLAGMKKGNSYADVVRSIRLARHAGIEVKANLIVDHPRIRADHVPEMLERLREIEDDLLSIGVHQFSLSPFAPLAFDPAEAGIVIDMERSTTPSDHGLHTLDFHREEHSGELDAALAAFRKAVQSASYRLDRRHGRVPTCRAQLRLPLRWQGTYAVPVAEGSNMLFSIPGAKAPFEFILVADE